MEILLQMFILQLQHFSIQEKTFYISKHYFSNNNKIGNVTENCLYVKERKQLIMQQITYQTKYILEA